MTPPPRSDRSRLLDGEAFWSWAAGVYGRSGVAAQALGLQDEQGANVNLLLLCLYLGDGGMPLGPDTLERLENTIGPWNREVTQGLRRVRRSLKAWPDMETAGALRKRIAQEELVAERVEQGLLLDAVDSVGALEPGPSAPITPGSTALENLKAYLALLTSRWPDGRGENQADRIRRTAEEFVKACGL